MLSCRFHRNYIMNFSAVASLLVFSSYLVKCSKIAERVWLPDLAIHRKDCIDASISIKNATSKIILTGTVGECQLLGGGSYKCSVQIWRVMKGNSLLDGLIDELMLSYDSYFNPKKFVDIYGLGKSVFCKSNVRTRDTKIFFLNRTSDRLLLSASFLRITLANLRNTQSIIEGRIIDEASPSHQGLCADVLCGYGAHCKEKENVAVCVCPDQFCPSSEQNRIVPVCGSNQITYINYCFLKLEQCMTQHKISIVPSQFCDSWTDEELCSDVVCSYSAECRVRLDEGVRKPFCVCPICDNSLAPVCGSDLRTYASECFMKLEACKRGLALFVVRKRPCDPCHVYNTSSGVFDRLCDGVCSYDDSGKVRCCDEIQCDHDDRGLVCGNDGNNYESECAMKKYACKSGRDIAVLQRGSCPRKKMVTKMRGSIPIQPGQCRGWCDLKNLQFKKLRRKLEKSIKRKLGAHKTNGKTLGGFRIVEGHSNASTLVFQMYLSTDSQPITSTDDPSTRYSWVIDLLYGDENGIFHSVLPEYSLSLDSRTEPSKTVIVEDVCFHRQCHFGQLCSVLRIRNRLRPVCSCGGVGARLAITNSCNQASNGITYINAVTSRKGTCESKSYLVYQNICPEKTINGCGSDACELPGSACIVSDEVEECRCLACDEEINPVCASNKVTFRNQCELERHNCMSRDDLYVEKKGVCDSGCDLLTCLNGTQCVETAEGPSCQCPTQCVDVHAPVCGSNCVTYQNQCYLAVEGCNKNIGFIHEGSCGEYCIIDIPEDECDCRFGAVCDELGECWCPIDCSEEFSSPVCASDQKTYLNRCEVKRTSCEQKQVLYVISNSSCPNNCQHNVHGCCADGLTAAKGSGKAGCPEVCKCSLFGSYSDTCDHVTGQCSCRPGVGGTRCDKCMLGYWNYQAVITRKRIGCTACHCSLQGSIRDDCDHVTGQCTCKEGYGGVKCTECGDNKHSSEKEDCGVLGPQSCETTPCPMNQACLRSEEGEMWCKCPSPFSCSNSSSNVVCSSDGVNYANTCHMNAITCRRGIEASVILHGLCEDLKQDLTTTSSSSPTSPTFSLQFNTSSHPQSSTNFELLTRQVDDVTSTFDASSKTTATSSVDLFPTKSNLSETTPSLLPTGESGGGCGLEDDEDCIDPTSTAPSFTPPTDLTTNSSSPPVRVIHYHGEGKFFEVSDQVLTYQASLSNPQSKLFQNYSDLVLSEMMDYANGPLLFGKISSISITSFWRLPLTYPNNRGVNVGFDLYVVQGTNVTEILDLLNELSNNSHYFHIRGVEDSNPDSINNPQSNYTEGGNWSTPQFGGASYFRFSLLEKVSSSVTFRMKFRSFDGEGLLIYAAHHPPSNDFVSLAIKRGRVEFRFNTGSGTLRLRSKVDVTKRSGKIWHSLVAHRNRRDGMLRVDREHARQGTSPKGTSGLNVDPEIFIGGFPQEIQSRLSRQVNVMKGLTGCIKRVSTKNRVFVIDSSSKNHSHKIGECQRSPCFPNPCEKSLNCFIKSENNKTFHECECSRYDGGDSCKKDSLSSDPCLNHQCHPSSNCTLNHQTNQSYDCICVDGRSGIFCQDEMNEVVMDGPSFMPAFAGDSFLVRRSLGRSVKNVMKINVVFYSSQPNGLIFYNGNRRSRDFVSLNLRDQHLEFIYELGNGIAILRSPQTISLNEWHKVSLSRSMRLGDMTIDEGTPVKGESPKFFGSFRNSTIYSRLNVNQPLYLGGFPNFTSLPKNAGVSQGLVGALQQLSVNGIKIPLSLKEADFFNVQPFNAHPCFHKPCKNGGICYPYLGGFNCACTKDWTGRFCDTIASLDEKPQREQAFSGVYFNGNVKAKYKNTVKRSISTSYNSYELHISTKSPQGLLLMVGRPTLQGMGDYLLLFINNGRVHLQYNLGSGPAHISSKTRVDNGVLTAIKVNRAGKVATLQINDNQVEQVEVEGRSVELNTDHFLWIGGVDYNPRGIGLNKSFFHPFIGCLSLLLIHDEAIKIEKDALNSPSFIKCT